MFRLIFEGKIWEIFLGGNFENFRNNLFFRKHENLEGIFESRLFFISIYISWIIFYFTIGLRFSTPRTNILTSAHHTTTVRFG